MLVLTSRKAQPECRLPLVGTANRHKGATEIAPLLIVRDESHRLSLGRLLSSRACLRFAGCVQFAMKEYGRSRNFRRTANSVLTVCVSSGDKRNAHNDTRTIVTIPANAVVTLVVGDIDATGFVQIRFADEPLLVFAEDLRTCGICGQ